LLNFEFDSSHATLFDALNLENQTVVLHDFAGLENVTRFSHQKTANRRVTFGFGNR